MSPCLIWYIPYKFVCFFDSFFVPGRCSSRNEIMVSSYHKGVCSSRQSCYWILCILRSMVMESDDSFQKERGKYGCWKIYEDCGGA